LTVNAEPTAIALRRGLAKNNNLLQYRLNCHIDINKTGIYPDLAIMFYQAAHDLHIEVKILPKQRQIGLGIAIVSCVSLPRGSHHSI